MYYLGIDLGSSSVKLALVDTDSGKPITIVQEPEQEMGMVAIKKGWAEQNPEDWWQHVCNGINKIKTSQNISDKDIHGIGISYQMHGLVLVDGQGKLLRDAIIWCDSRAVAIGHKAYNEMGVDFCNENLLNSPANFTASKLKWVQENEPELYKNIHKFMLPGDYIAYRFSGDINTTISGLSEGVFWNFKNNTVSEKLLEYYGISSELIPELVDTFSIQSKLSKKGAEESGLSEGTPILYRAGDQPNNALSLNIFNPGEIAATGGTSGVMYAVTENLSVKECDKVNNFAHVNYDGEDKLIGKLLCINGAGIQYRWLLNNLDVASYEEMNQLAASIEIGSDGIVIIPFGNGAERMFKNREVGTRIVNLNLNRHHKAHLCRAALEGIAFSFVYGFEIMQSDGIDPSVIRAGDDNLFRSEIFSKTIASLIGHDIEIYHTTGAVGAARACVLIHKDYDKYTSFTKNDHIKSFSPESEIKEYRAAYNRWKTELEFILKQ